MSTLADTIPPIDGHEVTTEQLYSRICVREPYFALSDMRRSQDGQLSANIPVQQSMTAEQGYISAAEAGRHLAILGLCACALGRIETERYYYLAHSARFERLPNNVDLPRAKLLRGKAIGKLTGNRSATASTVLESLSGIPIARLVIDYHVLTEKAFSRIYQSQRRDLRTTFRADDSNELAGSLVARRTNPYSSNIALQRIGLSPATLLASLDRIQTEWCKGHFPLYPALPVAIILSFLVRCAGELYLYRNPGIKTFAVQSGHFSADDLAFAGDSLLLEAHYQSSAENAGERFHCCAVSGSGRSVGIGEVVLSEWKGGE